MSPTTFSWYVPWVLELIAQGIDMIDKNAQNAEERSLTVADHAKPTSLGKPRSGRRRGQALPVELRGAVAVDPLELGARLTVHAHTAEEALQGYERALALSREHYEKMGDIANRLKSNDPDQIDKNKNNGVMRIMKVLLTLYPALVLGFIVLLFHYHAGLVSFLICLLLAGTVPLLSIILPTLATGESYSASYIATIISSAGEAASGVVRSFLGKNSEGRTPGPRKD